MTEIFLIRHAQAEGNLYRMMQGHWDGGVTGLGEKQIAALGRRFENRHLDAVYSSDLKRAMLTASALTKGKSGLRIVPRRELREIDIGPLETCFFGDLLRDIPEEMHLFMHDSAAWYHEGAETFLQTGERGLRALTEIAEGNEGKTVAAVSHGITIRSTLSLITGIPLSDSERLPICGNTAVTKLVYEAGKFTVESFNDISHVGDLPTWNGAVPSLSAENFDPADDPDWYSSCYADAWRCAHGNLKGYSPQLYLSAAVSHHAGDEGAVLRIRNGAETVGLIDMDTRRGMEDGAGWISQLYLCPEYRNRGLGIQVLARALMHYSSLGRNTLRLHVAESNKAALAFYRKWGFQEISSERNSLGRLLLMERPIREERNGI